MKILLSVFLALVIIMATPASVKADTPTEKFSITNYIIEVDGDILQSEFPIINYEDRAYTSARLIAEALGASVEFDERSGKIKITKPEPEIIEIVKEVIVEVPVYANVHSELPMSQVKNKVSIEISDIVRTTGVTYVYVSVENKNNLYALIKYRDLYIETDGERYISSNNFMWGSSIGTLDGRVEGQMLFEPIPSDAENITLVIPFKMQGSDIEYEFRFDILL